MKSNLPNLLIATRNEHKVREIRTILGDEFRLLTLNDFPGAPVVTEDAKTFAGNATKKASELVEWLSTVSSFKFQVSSAGLYVLADDSGLEVDALRGAPGVLSARFAALDGQSGTGAFISAVGNSSDAANNDKLLRLLKNIPLEKRIARFRCVIALESAALHFPLVHPVPEAVAFTELFEGVCEGRIGFGPRGKGGFGYDPLFIPSGYEQSFAELGDSLKNSISHRAKALRKLKERLRDSRWRNF